MTFLGFMILAFLLLAGGATAASCLIPELTVMGIWGIPVLGFALIVSVIFRIGVYYDPRQMSPERTKKNAVYLAASLLCHLGLWSSLDQIFVEGRSLSAILCTIIGGLTTIVTVNIADAAWLARLIPTNVVPLVCQIRAIVFSIASIIQLVGYLAGKQDLVLQLKPVVIFFAYANWVHFAAIYAGILQPQEVFASNGTIAERLKAWIRSKTQPGVLFSTVQTLLTTLFFSWLVLEAFCDIPARFSPISKGIFAAITAVSFYVATVYDPRKPPETSKLWLRILGGLVHFAIAAYYDWYVYTKDYRHFVTLITICLLRFGLLFGLMTQEMRQEVFQQNLIVIAFHLAMYTLSSVMFLLLNILSMSAIVQTVALTFSNVWFYYITIYIFAVIAGKYREVVRHVHPVQMPLEVLVDQSRELNAINV